MRGGRALAAGALLGGVIAAAGLSIAAMPALAHNYPVASSPAEGETVVEQPGVVSLTTNDELLDLGDGASLDVLGPDGRHYASECASLDGATVSAPAALGEPGEYTVHWRVVSTDGHPISGEFAFDWQPAAGVELAEGLDEPACDALRGDAAEETPAEPAAAEDGAGVPADVWWIGGAVVAIALAAVVTWLLTRRRRG